MWYIVDLSNGARNRTKDVGGSRKAPKEGLMGAPKRYSTYCKFPFLVRSIIFTLRKVNRHTDFFFNSFL